MLRKRLPCVFFATFLIFAFSSCNSNNPINLSAESTSTNTTVTRTQNTPANVTGNNSVRQENTVSSIQQQYELKCTYLKKPDEIKEIADKSAAFWKKAYDNVNGGYFTYVNKDGSVDKSKTYKVALIQSMDAYAFARAYQLTGKKEYLDFARRGLDFMYKNAWDKAHDGWYQEMNSNGTLASKPLEGMNWNSVKWSFNQFYAMSGICAMYDATRNSTDEEWLARAYSVLDEKLWDKRPGYEGYYDQAAADWSKPNGKTFGSTIDAITTHAMAMNLLYPDEKYKKRLLTLADNITNYMVKSMDQRQFGFVDTFDSNWKGLNPQPVSSSGNLLKPAWCLATAYLVDQKPEYKSGAEKLIGQILNSNAYDKTNGGCYASLDPKNGNPTDRKKSWWMLEQAVTSGLTNYYISGNTAYLKMADESMDFFMKHMYDPQFGEAYSDTDENGANPITLKGTYWKDAYHSLELFYYTYLYGNLMLYNKPVTLYYSIDSERKDRNLTLKPVALGMNKLMISSVTLNGKAYENFNGSECLLKLPANTGGEFAVTFKPLPVSK